MEIIIRDGGTIDLIGLTPDQMSAFEMGLISHLSKVRHFLQIESDPDAFLQLNEEQDNISELMRILLEFKTTNKD